MVGTVGTITQIESVSQLFRQCCMTTATTSTQLIHNPTTYRLPTKPYKNVYIQGQFGHNWDCNWFIGWLAKAQQVMFWFHTQKKTKHEWVKSADVRLLKFVFYSWTNKWQNYVHSAWLDCCIVDSSVVGKSSTMQEFYKQNWYLLAGFRFIARVSDYFSSWA